MLENLKIKLLKMAKEAEGYNLCKEGIERFSIRDESSGYIIITPAKTEIDNLSEDKICVFDLNGNKIEASHGINPSSDLQMHIEIYKAKKEIRTIMHIHPVYSSTFAVVNKVIPPVTYNAANYGGYIYVGNYNDGKNREAKEDFLEKLKTSDACLLESNGVVIKSNNVEDILFKARCVENVSEIYYKALVLNQFKEPTRLTREELTMYLANK